MLGDWLFRRRSSGGMNHRSLTLWAYDLFLTRNGCINEICAGERGV